MIRTANHASLAITSALFRPLKELRADDICYLTADRVKPVFAAEFYSRARGKSPAGGAYKDDCGKAIDTLIDRLPEKKFLKGQHCQAYELPITDTVCEVLARLLPADQLVFHDAQTQNEFHSTLMRSDMAELCAKWNVEFREKKTLPQLDLQFAEYGEGDDEVKYASYQKLATAMAVYSDGFNLFMEQGTGKTPVAIAAICNTVMQFVLQRKHLNRLSRILIVGPNNVRANWEHEIAKFTTLGGKTTVLRGPDVNRYKQILDAIQPEEGAEFTALVCGYGTLVSSIDLLAMVDWDIAVLDEAQAIRNPSTQRFKAACRIRDRAAKRLILTGTPIANGMQDLYAPLEFIGKGYSGFSTFKAYKKFYNLAEQNGPPIGDVEKAMNMPFMRERLLRYSFTIKKKEALPDLPDKQYNIVEVEMNPQQRDFYSTLQNELAIEIDKTLSNDNLPRSMQVSCILTQLLRLAQITSGYISWGATINPENGDEIHAKRIEYFSPNPKLEALLDCVIGKSAEEKFSVWSWSTPSIDAICHAFDLHKINYVRFTGSTKEADRSEALYRFNHDTTCQAWVGNAKSGGAGVNLLGYPPGKSADYLTNHTNCYIYDQNWSSVDRSQLEDRGHRRGTRVPLAITDFIVPGTIDEDIAARVMKKQMAAMQINDLRTIISSVFKNLNLNIAL